MTAHLKPKALSIFTAQGNQSSQEDFAMGRKEKGIFVVADGFGGSIAGAEAAKSACEAVVGFLEKEAGDLEATMPFVLRSYFSLAGNVLFNALIHANRKAVAMNRKKNIHERGGASVIAGFLDDGLMALANVGVCTAWLFRGSQMTELVIPRSYARLCDPVSKDPGDGLNVPLAALGLGEDLEPEIVEFRVSAGDWLLLQSDGLTGNFRDGLMDIRLQGSSAQDSAEKINSFLKSSSFDENASASVVLF